MRYNLFFMGFILIILSMVLILISINNTPKQEIPCYDKYNNEIIGVKCLGVGEDVFLKTPSGIVGSIFAFLGLILLFVFVNIIK